MDRASTTDTSARQSGIRRIPLPENRRAATPKLSDILIDAGLVNQSRWDGAQRVARETGLRTNDVLLDQGELEEGVLAAVLSRELSLPWVRPACVRPDLRLVEMLPRWIAEAICALPILIQNSDHGVPTLFVAVDDPTNEDTLLACSLWTGLPARAMVATRREIRETIADWFEELEGMQPLSAEDIVGIEVSAA